MDDVRLRVVGKLFACTQRGAPAVAIFRTKRLQFVADHLPARGFVVQQGAQFRCAAFLFLALGLDFFDFQPRKLVQADVENGVGLHLVEREPLYQRGAGILAGRGFADQPNDRGEVVGDHRQPGQHVQPFFEFGQFVREPFGHHLQPKIQEMAAQVGQGGAQRLADLGRGGRHQTRQVDRHRRLQQGMPAQIGHRQIDGGVPLEFEHDPHVVRGLVAHVHDLRELSAADQFGDFFDELRLVDRVRQRGDDDLPLAARPRLHLPLPAQFDRAVAFFVDGAQLALGRQNFPARRKIRALDVAQQAGGRDARVVDHRQQRPHHLAEVVRRDVGRHADGDAARAVEQQLRNRGRQHDRLVERGVVIRPIRNRGAGEVAEQFVGQRRQLGLGIAHGRGAVAVQRAEVPFALHERVAQRERLRQADHRVVRGLIAVRMVFAEHLAHDGRGFARPRVAGQPQILRHGVQQPALDRLEPVADVWQRPRSNDAQRVIEIAPFGFGAQVRGENPLRHRRLFHTLTSTARIIGDESKAANVAAARRFPCTGGCHASPKVWHSGVGRTMFPGPRLRP